MHDPALATGDYLHTTEAARILDVSAETVRAWHRAGKLRAAITTSRGLRLFSRVVVEQKRAEREAACAV